MNMLDHIFKVLEKEKNMIKKTPFHFTVAVLTAVVIISIAEYSLFRTALTLQSDTIAAYKAKFEALGASLGPNGSVQVLTCSKNPNEEKLIPATTNAAAIAYRRNGSAMFMWDIDSQSWK